MGSGFSYAILFSLSPFHPNLKRHLRICRFIVVPNVHLIAFRRAQHDEVQILRFLRDVEGHRALIFGANVAVHARAVRQIRHKTVA